MARSVAYRLLQLEVRRRLADLDVNQSLWVSPEQLEFSCILTPYQKYADRGKVIGGDWDLERQRFAELDVYQAFEAHFLRGVPWSETPVYQSALATIVAGTIKWDCRSQDQLDARFRRLDALYSDFKANGYKAQDDIARTKGNSYKGEDEISVRIARDGELLFEDGRHRLSIAKLLSVPRLPIKVTARHTEWVQFRREILRYAAGRDNTVYQPLLHPDLQAIPSRYDHQRYELIRANLPFMRGTLLDIGAHWGYFCQRFDSDGFDCTAVESSGEAAYFLEKLRIAGKKHFTVVNKSIFDYHDRQEFDVVLALNIFHHFLKTEASYQRLTALLGRLKVGVMILQTHQVDSEQMAGAFRDYDPDSFANWVAAQSGLDQVTKLGETKDARPIYRLESAA